jgi:crescentin
MSKLSDMFGRKGGETGVDRPAVHANGNGKHANGNADHHIAIEHYSSVGSRIGEENEALRNLLFDTGRKIGELDDLKSAFDKIVAPFNNTLRALEEEKSQNLSLRAALDESRKAYETLRAEFYQIEKRATLLESENVRLREDLELSREQGRGLESSRSELHNQISSQSAQIGELERQLSHESSQRQMLSENKRSLTEQFDATEKRVVGLEGELAAARERLALLDDEKGSLQTALDQSVNETARLTRRLTESENTLTATRAQLGKVETSFAETFAERSRLSAALDEARDQHQTEHNSLNMRVDALQSRAATAEKLLAEARQNLIARTEEVRAFDRKAVEATISRNNADKRLAQIELTHESRERQIKDLEQSRAALVERTNALTKTLKTRETALSRAEEKIQQLTERSGRLEADIQVNRTTIEKRVEDLDAALQRERMERAVVEGALEAARKDNSRLQSEIGSLRSTLRRGAPLEESTVRATESEPSAKPKRGKSSDMVEPILKS